MTNHPASALIEAITGDAGSACTFQVIPDHKGSPVRPCSMRGRFTDLRQTLQRYNDTDAGVFVTVNQTRGRRRTKADVTAVRALFIDSDALALPEAWALPISALTSRSPTKWHAYWRLAPGENLRRWEGAMRALAKRYGTDLAVCELARVMRLPGFRHAKNPDAPSAYVLQHADPSAVYTIDQVLAAHGIDPAGITEEPETKPEPVPLDGHEINEHERARLLERLEKLSASYQGAADQRSRDRMIGGWIVDAVAACMPEDEIELHAQTWLLENGRAAQANEIPNWMRSAKRNLKAGRMGVRTPGVRVDRDFPEPPPPPSNEKRLSDEEARDQVKTLTDWTAEVPKSREGVWKSHPRTVQLILTHDGRVADSFRFNQLSCMVEVMRAPWRTWSGDAQWTDDDGTAFVCWAARAFDARPTLDAAHVHAAVRPYAKQFSYHPIRDYLQSLSWDGKPRLDAWLSTYLGVAASDYVAAVGSKTLIAACARIMRPGCKVDTMLILEGDQGQGKSTALAILGQGWFSDAELDITTKDAAQLIRGVWLYELGELHTLKRAEVAQLKGFITRQVDRQRDAYGRHPEAHPRQTVFIGTTNQDEYLKDETGNRRFWPVRTGTLDLERLAQDRDQLWAEAFRRFEAGEAWWLTRDLERLAAVEQDARLQVDPWEDQIAAWLSDPTGFDGGPCVKVTASEVWKGALYGSPNGPDSVGYRRIAAVLRRLGFVRRQVKIDGRNVKGFVRGATEATGATTQSLVSSAGIPGSPK